MSIPINIAALFVKMMEERLLTLIELRNPRKTSKVTLTLLYLYKGLAWWLYSKAETSS